MKFWLSFPLFALAQASCYDYEYYDPDTGSSVPGNACAKQAAATVGQPQIAAQFQPQVAQTFGAPLASQPVAPLAYSTSVPFTSAPMYSVPATTTPVIRAAPVLASPSAVVRPTVVSPPAAVAQTIIAPQAVTVRAPAATADVAAKQRELEYYKELGERQQRQHRQNSRDVQEASRDLSRFSLINRVIAGSGNAAPWYPALRLGAQKDAAQAYRSEKRMAAKNAEDAYQRYQKDPSRLNLLVSKYQDLNADLRDAAFDYNVANSGTFGQRIAQSSSIFGGLGGLGGIGLTQIITQRRQSENLNDIQRQMQRIARQIQTEARAAKSGAQVAPVQGSVQQRMMAMNVYGPQTRSG